MTYMKYVQKTSL